MIHLCACHHWPLLLLRDVIRDDMTASTSQSTLLGLIFLDPLCPRLCQLPVVAHVSWASSNSEDFSGLT